MGEKQRKRRRWRGRDRESGQTCAVLLGHSSAHGLSARLKATLCFKREPWRFFYVYKNIFIYFSSLCHLSIYFLLSQHPLLCHWNHVRWRRHTRPPLFFPLSFNTTAVENQTALKQIDVLFNIVVTSSQGPHASALVTTAGLLSLPQRWLPLCWSLQWFITKKRGRLWEWEERKWERQKEKSPGSWLSHWHLWLTRSNQLISILLKLIACGAALYLAWCELWARLGPLGAGPGPLCLSKRDWNQSLMSCFHFAGLITEVFSASCWPPLKCRVATLLSVSVFVSAAHFAGIAKLFCVNRTSIKGDEFSK